MVLRQTRTRWPGLELLLSSDDITRTTQWRIREARHTFVVHLGGEMRELETELDGHGGSRGPAMPGEVWSIPAETRYASQARGGTIRYAVLYAAPGESGAEKAVAPVAGVYDRFLHAAVRELAAVAEAEDDLGQMLGQSLSAAVNSYLQRAYAGARVPAAERGRTGALDAATARRLRDHIFERLAERVTLDDLAAVAGMSTHRLLAAFQPVFGTTPRSYIIAQRLRCAQRLLSGSRKDITTIALEAGFASHSHLTACFRARLDCTPSEFRRQTR